jgi:hypothetical protein
MKPSVPLPETSRVCKSNCSLLTVRRVLSPATAARYASHRMSPEGGNRRGRLPEFCRGADRPQVRVVRKRTIITPLRGVADA